MRLLLTGLLSVALSAAAFAGAGSPVQHSHEGRTHTHPLPEAGRNHNHKSGGAKKQSGKVKTPKGWSRITSSDRNIVYAKHRSYGEGKNKANEEIVYMVIQWLNRKTQMVLVEKVYISKRDCRREVGVSVYLDIDGKFKYESEFAKGGLSIGSGIADALCSVYSSNINKEIL